MIYWIYLVGACMMSHIWEPLLQVLLIGRGVSATAIGMIFAVAGILALPFIAQAQKAVYTYGYKSMFCVLGLIHLIDSAVLILTENKTALIVSSFIKLLIICVDWTLCKSYMLDTGTFLYKMMRIQGHILGAVGAFIMLLLPYLNINQIYEVGLVIHAGTMLLRLVVVLILPEIKPQNQNLIGSRSKVEYRLLLNDPMLINFIILTGVICFSRIIAAGMYSLVFKNFFSLGDTGFSIVNILISLTSGIFLLGIHKLKYLNKIETFLFNLILGLSVILVFMGELWVYLILIIIVKNSMAVYGIGTEMRVMEMYTDGRSALMVGAMTVVGLLSECIGLIIAGYLIDMETSFMFWCILILFIVSNFFRLRMIKMLDTKSRG